MTFCLIVDFSAARPMYARHVKAAPIQINFIKCLSNSPRGGVVTFCFIVDFRAAQPLYYARQIKAAPIQIKFIRYFGYLAAQK